MDDPIAVDARAWHRQAQPPRPQAMACIGLQPRSGHVVHARLMQAALLSAARRVGLAVRVAMLDAGPPQFVDSIHALWLSDFGSGCLPGRMRAELAFAWRRDLPVLVSGSACLTTRLLQPAAADAGHGAGCESRLGWVEYGAVSMVARVGVPGRRQERMLDRPGGWRPCAEGAFAAARVLGVSQAGEAVYFEHPGATHFVATSVIPECPVSAACAHPLLKALVVHATAVARQQRRRGDPGRSRLSLEAHQDA